MFSVHPQKRATSGWLLAATLAMLLVFGSACGAGRPTAMQRATSLALEHREADAIRILREFLTDHPDDIASRRLLVRVLAAAGNLGDARLEVGVLEQRLGSSDPIPWIELGHAYEMNHDYEAALAMYDHAAEVAESDARGPREGGLRAARWGEVDWARPRLEEAIRRGANDVETWHTLGLVRVLGKDLRGAEQAYRAGSGVDPAALECHVGLATVAVMRGDAALALTEYDWLATKRPGWAPAHLGRAWALGRLGRKQEAKAAIAEAGRLGSQPDVVARQLRLLEDTTTPARQPTSPSAE